MNIQSTSTIFPSIIYHWRISHKLSRILAQNLLENECFHILHETRKWKHMSLWELDLKRAAPLSSACATFKLSRAIRRDYNFWGCSILSDQNKTIWSLLSIRAHYHFSGEYESSCDISFSHWKLLWTWGREKAASVWEAGRFAHTGNTAGQSVSSTVWWYTPWIFQEESEYGESFTLAKYDRG